MTTAQRTVERRAEERDLSARFKVRKGRTSARADFVCLTVAAIEIDDIVAYFLDRPIPAAVGRKRAAAVDKTTFYRMVFVERGEVIG